MIGGQVVVLVVLTGVGRLVPDSIMPQITCMVHWTLIHRAPKIIIVVHRHSGHTLEFSNLHPKKPDAMLETSILQSKYEKDILYLITFFRLKSVATLSFKL